MRVPGPGTAVLLAMCHFVALDWLSWEAVVLIKTTSKNADVFLQCGRAIFYDDINKYVYRPNI